MNKKIFTILFLLSVLTWSSASAALPIKAHLNNTVGKSFHMETSVTVSKNGRIDGVTTTKSCRDFGFTGGVWAILHDKQGNFLHVTNVKRYGVNGRNFFTKECSKRKERWSEQVPLSIVNKTHGIIIHHAHNPKIRNQKEIKEILKKYLES